MNDIEELIAAGEAALIERNLVSKNIEESLIDSNKGRTPNGSDALTSPIFNGNQYESSCESTKKSINNFAEDGKEVLTEINSSSSINSQLTDMEGNCEDKTLLHSLKNHCGDIYSLGLSMRSSLSNANRLLNNILRTQPNIQTSYEKSLLEEVNLCEKNSTQNEESLQKIGEKIHCILARLSDQQRKFDNKENELKLVHERAFNILSIVAELLNKTGFKHLTPNITQNGMCMERLLEEINLGLLLLSGELPNCILQNRNHELEVAHSKEEKLKEQLKSIQEQYSDLIKTKERKISQLEINLEKLQKDADDLKYQLSISEEQKANLEESFKKELSGYEEEITAIRHQMVKVQQDSKSSVKQAEETYMFDKDKTACLIQEVDSLKSQIQSKNEQMEALQEDFNGQLNKLNAKFSKQGNEVSTLKAKIAETNEEKNSFGIKIKKLQSAIEEQISEKQTIAESIDQMKQAAANAKLLHGEELEAVHIKLDSVNTTLCEKNSEVRSRDVKIMQLETELKLEGQQSLVFKGENDLLEKQVKRLQDKIVTLLEGRSREEALLVKDTKDTLDIGEYKVARELKKSQERERQLKDLLEQKDLEMKSLQESLRTQLFQKNSELHKLSESVESLENEMESISCSLKVSKSFSDITDHVTEALESRSSALYQLQNSSDRLKADCARISKSSSKLDEQEKVIDELTNELSVSKKVAREAREAARNSRIEAAKEKQKCAFLKIDLESAQDALKQIRLEQDLWKGLSSVKDRIASSYTSEILSLDLGSQSSILGAEAIKDSNGSLEDGSKLQ